MSRIFLILNDPLAAGRVRSSLDSAEGLQVVGWATTLAQADEAIQALKPDLVLSDLELIDGLFEDFIAELASKRRYGGPQTMVLAMSLDDGRVMAAMGRGADGYFLQNHSTKTLAATVLQVLAGGSPMAPAIARQLKTHFDALAWDHTDFVGEAQNPLRPSDAERLLLNQIAGGREVEEIARAMQTGEQVLAQRLRGLYRKLRFDNSAATLTLNLV